MTGVVAITILLGACISGDVLGDTTRVQQVSADLNTDGPAILQTATQPRRTVQTLPYKAVMGNRSMFVVFLHETIRYGLKIVIVGKVSHLASCMMAFPGRGAAAPRSANVAAPSTLTVR